MSVTMPMIAPDGTTGDIPSARVADATAAGFKPATRMLAPTGELGYIPNERVSEATQAGFKPETPIAPQPITGKDMETSLAPQLVRGTTATLPAAGAVAGATLTSPGVATAAAGGALGGAAGAQSELLINRGLFGKDEPSTVSKEGLLHTGVSAASGAFQGGTAAYAAKNAASPFVASGEAALTKTNPAEWQKVNQIIGATPKSLRFGEGINDVADVTTNPGRGLAAKGLDSDTLSKMTPFERLQAVAPIKQAAGAAVNKAASDATAAGTTLDIEKSAFQQLQSITDDSLQTKAVDTLHKLVQQAGIDDVRNATPEEALQLRRLLAPGARFGPTGDLSSLAGVRAQLYRAVSGDLHAEVPEMIPVDKDFSDLKVATDLIKNGVAKSLVKEDPTVLQKIFTHPVYGPLARGAMYGAGAAVPAGFLGYLGRDYLRGLFHD